MVTAENAAVLGMILLPIGLLQWRYAEPLARIEEQFDAIGSKRSWSSVEPAEWKVLLTKYTGVTIAAASALGILWWLAVVLLG